METLANLESFVRSAETGSFSAAARRLALTPAAVSRNVALLERNLGVRLFQRSTRKLTLTEAGERFLVEIGGNLDALQAAIASVSTDRGEPAGVLKVSMAPTFGITYVMPLLPAFLARYPMIRPDWHFENRTGRPDCRGIRCRAGRWIRSRAGRRVARIGACASRGGGLSGLHGRPRASRPIPAILRNSTAS